MRIVLLAAVGLLLAGCGANAPWRPMADWLHAWRTLERADGLAQRGDHVGARDLYEEVLREYPGSPWTDRALWGLGRLQVAPDSPLKNYRQAHAHFDRLVRDHPQSQYAGDARAWRETLAQLLTREQEAARIRQDVERLKRIELRLEQEAGR